ncbi:metallopeptidase family protein [Roseinatronobacter ekhonensis]|nr:metallopeptidase family protein [Roseibaca ekhonensis]
MSDQAPWTNSLPPDDAAFLALVTTAIADLPAPFDAHARAVAVQVVDFAPDAILDEMGIEDPFELTGLYDGTPLPDKLGEQALGPDTIWLFRRPILDEWVARGDVPLGHLVAHVYLHELAHHFGWSDADIARIAPWMD